MHKYITSKILAVFFVLLSANSALAQNYPAIATQATRLLDSNNVDLTSGELIHKVTDLSIGTGGGSLELIRGENPQINNWIITLSESSDAVHINANFFNKKFYPHCTPSACTYEDANQSGETLSEADNYNNRFYKNRDGIIYNFLQVTGQSGLEAYATSIIYPTGQVYSLTWLPLTFCDESWTDDNGDGIEQESEHRNAPCYTRYRLQSVRSSSGYQLKFKYRLNLAHNISDQHLFYEADDWLYLTDVYAINANSQFCEDQADSCSLSSFWQHVSYAYSNPAFTTATVTEPDGGVWQYGYQYTGANGSGRFIKRPGSSEQDIIFSQDNVNSVGQNYINKHINYGGITFDYRFDYDNANNYTGNTLRVTGTRTSPSGATIKATTESYRQFRDTCDPNLPCGTFDADEHVTSEVTGDDAVTGYIYDRVSGRKLETDFPDGRRELYSYDSRGNVTATTVRARPGSGLSDIYTSAGFDATCVLSAKCNKPNWTRDAQGNQTDYTYDPVTGQTLTVTGPPASPGAVRPQTRNSYRAYQAIVRNAGGGLSPTGQSISLLTAVSVCASSASCSGTADETRTTYVYDPNISPNLGMVAKTIATGDGSAVTTNSYSYDQIGNVLAVDGPAPGTADTTRYRYDIARRLTGRVEPDPDGAGPLPPIAERYSYDVSGRLVRFETGNVADQSDAAWQNFAVLKQNDTIYDSRDNKIRETESAGGSLFLVTQYSYDSDDRLKCTTVRMKPATWDSLPSAACDQSVASAPFDRITRQTYDNADHVILIEQGVGSDTPVDYARYTYSLTGKQTSITDANGNKAALAYDGFDRLVQWSFPSPSAVGSVSTTDYEAYGYDANGNRTSLRKRDGRTIAYAYDALNRVTAKTYPNGGARRVYYSYDLRGLQTAARFDSTSGGDAVLSGWDGLGRQRSSTTSMGGTSRTLAFRYDADSNRVRIDYPDGHYTSYGYDGIGRMASLQADGWLNFATFGYEATGQLMTKALMGGSTAYQYDGIGRLQQMATGFTSSGGYAVTTSYLRNPAGQVTSRTRSNDAYAFTGSVNVDRGYGVNGLNQYVSAGPAAFGYDANGNLVSDGSSSFAYDLENRLVSASGARTASLAYDPLGRLYQVTGASGATQFLYDGDQLSDEYDTGGLRHRYLHGTGEDDPLVQLEPGGPQPWRLLYADEQGSIMAMADSNGAVIGVNAYDEYGIPNATNIGRFQYTGQAWLPELGMYYYKARLYSPTLGRFLQTDPIGYSDQINLYNYVSDDPINKSDPSGLRTCDGFVDCTVMLGEKVASTARNTRVAITLAAARASVLLLPLATGCDSPPCSKRVFATYTKKNDEIRKVYSGRVSIVVPGSVSNEQAGLAAIARRESGHHMDKNGYGPAEPDKASTNGFAIRGREQQLIDYYGGARNEGGTSGNAINGISKQNILRPFYMEQADQEFGHLKSRGSQQCGYADPSRC